MKTAVIVSVGFLSSFMFYLVVGLLLYGLAGIILLSPTLKLSIFLECWALSAVILAYKADTVAKVIERGFLLGAAEWLVVTLSGVFFNHLPLVAVSMMLSCLAGYTTARLRRGHWQQSNPYSGHSA